MDSMEPKTPAFGQIGVQEFHLRISMISLLQVVLDKNVCEEGVLEEAEFYNITGPLYLYFYFLYKSFTRII